VRNQEFQGSHPQGSHPACRHEPQQHLLYNYKPGGIICCYITLRNMVKHFWKKLKVASQQKDPKILEACTNVCPSPTQGLNQLNQLHPAGRKSHNHT
jgi:hypothetical protein